MRSPFTARLQQGGLPHGCDYLYGIMFTMALDASILHAVLA
jgi:hypothetical protein